MGLAVAFSAAEAATQGTVQLTAHYSISTCDGPPTFVEIEKTTSCVVDKCSKAATGSKTSTSCSSSDKIQSILKSLFGASPFILREAHDDPNCTTLRSAKALKVGNECVQDAAVGLFIRSQLDSDGSISVQYFTDASCSLGCLHHTDLVPRTTAEKHSCDPKALKWYVGRHEHRALTQMADTNSTDEQPADTNSAANEGNDGSGLDNNTHSGSDTTTDDTATSKSSDTNPDENEANTAKSSDKGSNDEATTAPTPTGDSNAASNSTTTPTPTTESPTTTTTTPPVTTSIPAPTRASPAPTSPPTVSKASSAASSSDASSTSDATNAPTSTAATEGTTEDPTTEASASGSSAVPVSSGKSSNLTVFTLVGVAAVTIALVIVILALIVRRLRAEHKKDHIPAPATERREESDRYSVQTSPFQPQRRYTKLVQKPYLLLEPSDKPIQQHPSEQQTRDQRGSASVFNAPSKKTEMWSDDVILACRVPKDKLQVQERISCGAFNEVYRGQYERKRVAIKMLLPEMRLDAKRVNEFIREAKRTATMTHPHVVSFIGVAWNAPSDVCVVMEYMDGGDLRSLLSDYEATRHPVGFDNEKATIALHVCRALAYMHTQSTPMIHRDLKSRNILLNRAMEAKLTDFGISREKLDEKMTAGVGTSLWVAPEVLMGNFYDEKADIFSFGVVLSELDTHLLPYSNAMTSPGSSQTEGALMLQNVVSGSLQVEFSQQGPRTIAELGRACTALDPSERPKAAEIVNILQDVLSEELLECSL
ncbi:hypothetical protein PR003_g7127 [Phytophthora rubi]|nr:hypothetical protein PR002_g7097 [Phytophthora rubi]KAE9347069.1 hypothetical protein PR003_g7127 [Phytophthora rubi]